MIGRWIAEALQSAGCDLCLTDVGSTSSKLACRDEACRRQLCKCRRPDRATPRSDALVAEIGKRWGAADILVNNAGIYPSGFLLDIDVAEFDRIFAINLRAPFILTRRRRHADDQGRSKGSIINISSGASRKMRRTVVPYCTSKTALDRLTKGFAVELAEFGIRVNALEPGFAAGQRR